MDRQHPTSASSTVLMRAAANGVHAASMLLRAVHETLRGAALALMSNEARPTKTGRLAEIDDSCRVCYQSYNVTT